MVVDNSRVQADSQPRPVGLVWGFAASLCSANELSALVTWRQQFYFVVLLVLLLLPHQKQQSQLKQAMDEATKTSDAVQQVKETKQQQDNNVVEQLRTIVAQKQAKIDRLELELHQQHAMTVGRLSVHFSILCVITHAIFSWIISIAVTINIFQLISTVLVRFLSSVLF